MDSKILHRIRQGITLLVAALMLPAQLQAGAAECGRITALLPSASHNQKVATVQAKLQWKDFLKTDASGRLRANLLDGSILSLGRESHLIIVKHDANSQQTALELNYGRLRSQVAAITRAGGNFELRTPVAVVGVIGTDFYVYATADMTLVICYSGKLVVTPVVAGAVAATAPNQPVTLTTGEMLEIRGGVAGSVQPLTSEIRDETIAETHVANAAPSIVQRSWVARHKALLIGIGAVAAGGIIAATATGTPSSSGHSDSHYQ